MLKRVIIVIIGIIIISLFIWFLNSQKLISPGENSKVNKVINDNTSLVNDNNNQDLSRLNENINNQLVEEFCGWSTESNCSTNDDCLVDGCSGQVCRAKNDAFIGTTCEWRECYDETKYDFTCQCVNNQCQWFK